MRILIRAFFKTVRLIVGPMLLGYEAVASRRPRLSELEQQALDAKTKGLTLYQFKTCPFCVKVRIQMARLGLRLTKRDAQKDEDARKQLLAGGGELKVPCLRIEDDSGSVRWMYESKEIVSYLENLAAA